MSTKVHQGDLDIYPNQASVSASIENDRVLYRVSKRKFGFKKKDMVINDDDE